MLHGEVVGVGGIGGRVNVDLRSIPLLAVVVSMSQAVESLQQIPTLGALAHMGIHSSRLGQTRCPGDEIRELLASFVTIHRSSSRTLGEAFLGRWSIMDVATGMPAPFMGFHSRKEPGF
jgi:hypothetical protein